MSGRSARTPKAKDGALPPSSSRGFFIQALVLPGLSALIYSLSFPSFLSPGGWGFLAYAALIPYCYALLRLSVRAAPLASIVFSTVAYGLMTPWLFSYHPAAPLAVLTAMGISGAAFSLPFSYFQKRWPYFGFMAAAAAWVAMEYCRNSGFLAFPYGILGLSQHRNSVLLQSASVWGIWGLSFALVASSSFAAGLVHSILRASRSRTEALWRWRRPALCLLALLLASHTIGFLFPDRYPEDVNSISILAIQPDNRPRRQGALPASWYGERLLSLIEGGLAAHPGSDIVMCPETAFPPSIELRLEGSGEGDEDRAVRSFMRSLSAIDVPVILGNDRGKFGLTPAGERDRLHYNAALFTEGGRVLAAYEKNRLVPFIEYFPFYRAFPSLYRFAERENGMLWTPGSRIAAFPFAGAAIGTPICYEDCFGELCREFVRDGAALLAPMTSDAWSGSGIAMRQHLAGAVFRAVETRRPVVRVSNNGITCSITPRGRIEGALPAFGSGFASYEVALPSPSRTPYVLWGDWLALFCVLLCAALAVHALSHGGFAPRPPRSKSFIDKTAGM